MQCPRCGSSLKVDSNRSMEISEVTCNDCGFGFQAPVTEECIEKMLQVIAPDDVADE